PERSGSESEKAQKLSLGSCNWRVEERVARVRKRTLDQDCGSHGKVRARRIAHLTISSRSVTLILTGPRVHVASLAIGVLWGAFAASYLLSEWRLVMLVDVARGFVVENSLFGQCATR